MRRIGTWTAAAVLGAGLLAGCGGSDTEAYCDGLKDAQELFSGGVDPKKLDEMFDKIDDITDDAPDAVKADWEQLNGALADFQDALKAAGLNPDELDDFGDMKDVDPEAMATLEEAAAKIQTDFEGAEENIQKHAKDECDIDMGA